MIRKIFIIILLLSSCSINKDTQYNKVSDCYIYSDFVNNYEFMEYIDITPFSNVVTADSILFENEFKKISISAHILPYDYSYFELRTSETNYKLVSVAYYDVRGELFRSYFERWDDEWSLPIVVGQETCKDKLKCSSINHEFGFDICLNEIMKIAKEAGANEIEKYKVKEFKVSRNKPKEGKEFSPYWDIGFIRTHNLDLPQEEFGKHGMKDYQIMTTYIRIDGRSGEIIRKSSVSDFFIIIHN